jgi:hypothetical protein
MSLCLSAQKKLGETYLVTRVSVSMLKKSIKKSVVALAGDVAICTDFGLDGRNAYLLASFACWREIGSFISQRDVLPSVK